MPRQTSQADPAVQKAEAPQRPMPRLTSLPLSTFESTGGTASISDLFTENSHKSFPMRYRGLQFSVTYDQIFYTPNLHRRLLDPTNGLSRGDRTILALEAALVRWGLTRTVAVLDDEGEPVNDEHGHLVTREEMHPLDAGSLGDLPLEFLTAVWEAVQLDMLPNEGEGQTSAAG
jgi:hypothetical protein